MTTAPSTVADLFDESSGLDRHQVLRDRLAEINGLTAPGARMLRSQVVDALTGLLDIDLAELVVSGWAKHRDLRAAARRTAASSGPEEVVLANHQISSTHRPSVEIYVENARVATVEFELEVWVRLTSVVAIVRTGRLVGIRSGDTDVGARLSTAGQTIAERRVRCAAGALIPLGSGIPLLNRPEPPPRPSPGAGAFRPTFLTRRAAVLVAVVILSIAGATIASATVDWAPTQGVAGSVRPGTTWNLRSGPSQGSPSVGTIQSQTEVRVECMRGDWAKLSHPRSGVYVHSRALQLESAPPSCAPGAR
jgi:hypothetical protein